MWCDRVHIETRGRAELSDDFIHEDRRPLIGLPPMGPDAYIDAALQLFETRTWDMWIEEVIAVRGDRLALMVRAARQNDWDPVRKLVILQYDEEVDRLERYIGFEEEQLDEGHVAQALELLDQMHTEIEPGH